jgi:hypothetical protein
MSLGILFQASKFITIDGLLEEPRYNHIFCYLLQTETGHTGFEIINPSNYLSFHAGINLGVGSVTGL